MRTVLLHIPSEASCDAADARKRVSEMNAAILLGESFPATAFISVKDLVGDPQTSFSDEICELLHAAAILTRKPATNMAGAQLKLDGKPLWDYAWGEYPFRALSDEQLLEVGWDLRYSKNFVHLSLIDDTPEEVLDQPPEQVHNALDDDGLDSDE